MSHFLTRLVQRARGTAPRVEPLIAPRFASTPIEIASEVETPRPTWPDQQPTVKEQSSPHVVFEKEASAEKAEPKILPEAKTSPPSQQLEKLLVPIEKSAIDATGTVRPSPSAGRPVAAVKNGMVGRNSLMASRLSRPRPATPPTSISHNLERDLLMPNESPEQPPIIRVTIGRIDVRAVPPAAPARKSPTHSEPKLTLDAYLKSRREGRR